MKPYLNILNIKNDFNTIGFTHYKNKIDYIKSFLSNNSCLSNVGTSNKNTNVAAKITIYYEITTFSHHLFLISAYSQ